MSNNEKVPMDTPLEHGTKYAPLNVETQNAIARTIQIEFDKLAFELNKAGVGQVLLDRFAGLAATVRGVLANPGPAQIPAWLAYAGTPLEDIPDDGQRAEVARHRREVPE